MRLLCVILSLTMFSVAKSQSYNVVAGMCVWSGDVLPCVGYVVSWAEL